VVAISCNLLPGPAVVEQARLAEDLGYSRAYLTDAPALYQDVWAGLTLLAERTERIGLGTGVLVPYTRHPVVNAAAIATIEHLAPGRLVVGVGTGNSARRTLGYRGGSSLSYIRSYIETLRALLRGEAAEWEGRPVALIPHPGHMPQFPIEVPILLSAFGPKGLQVALDCADGVIGGVDPRFRVCIPLVFGTVLDDGEQLETSERAIAAHGPMALTSVHNMYEDQPEALGHIPGGHAWRARIDAQAEPGRAHLLVHRGHCAEVTANDSELAHDRGFLAFSRGFTWTGSRAEVATRIAQAVAAGASEILYLPAGPDVPRELEAFADAASQVQEGATHA
jgi:5,10-methylenetetrahydromethanopterin reductase